MCKSLNEILNEESQSGASLVGQFRRIEKSSISEEEKSNQDFITLQNWLNDPLVYSFVTGETTPTLEFEKIAKRHGGLKAFIPHLSNRRDRETYANLERVLGSGIDEDSGYAYNFSNLVFNPVTTGSMASIIGYSSTGNVKETIIAGLVGAGICALLSMLKLAQMENGMGIAQYLETKINEIKTKDYKHSADIQTPILKAA